MIALVPHCPSCHGNNVQEVVYGYPTPQEMEKAGYVSAVLAGPRPYDLMPTLRCSDCKHWWRHDGVKVHFPSKCDFCGEDLTADEKTTFATAVDEYWQSRQSEADVSETGLFGFHPLPTCALCVSEIQELQSARRTEQELQETNTRRLRRFMIYLAVAWMTALAVLLAIFAR